MEKSDLIVTDSCKTCEHSLDSCWKKGRCFLETFTVYEVSMNQRIPRDLE